MKFRMLLSLALLCLIALGGVPAFAGFEMVQQDVTLTTTTSVDVTLAKSTIKEVYLYCPTLDDDDTCTLSMALVLPVSGTTTDTIVPNGWTDYLVGATADNDLLKVLSASTSIYCDGPTRWTVTPSSTQEASRTFRLFFLLEN